MYPVACIHMRNVKIKIRREQDENDVMLLASKFDTLLIFNLSR